MEKLALYGGKPIRTKSFPTVDDASGRDLGDEEIGLLIEVIKSGKLNRNTGTKVKLFEKKFAEKIGAKFGIATTSGTAALHTAVAAINPDPGDEIITSPITDMGTIIAILFQNAIPIFADVDPLTGNLDPESVRRKITNLLKEIEGVTPIPKIKNTTHSYWMYSFTIDEKNLRISTVEFIKALKAEGIPFGLGYGGGPLRDLPRAPLIFEYDVLSKKKTYGSSNCPYDCPKASKVEYKKDEYPNALLFQQRVCAMSWNEGITEQDVYDIVRGIKKVVTFYRQKH